MPKLAAKHQNQSTQVYGDFTGGLNTAAAEEFIEDNQLSEVVNMEADSISKKLYTVLGTKTLGTLDSSFGNIVSSYYDNINKEMLVFTDEGKILKCSEDYSEFTYLGDLTGTDYDNIKCASWEDGVLVSSGGKLQYIKPDEDGNYADVNTLEDSPDSSNFVFIRSGRVVVCDGDDTLLYSGVGDETNWEQDPNDPSAALFAEIGYKAGGKIVSVTSNSKDIIICKDNGLCYKLENEYPDWNISEVSRELYCNSADGSCDLGNGTAMVLGNGILQSVSTTQDYGDMKPSQMGQQVALQIAALPEDTKLKYIASLNQVWFITGTQYVLVYDVGTQAFYQRWFNSNVTNVTSVGQKTYIFKENSVCVIDFNDGKCEDDGEPLIYQARLKTEITLNNILVKRVAVSVTPMVQFYDTADCKFSIGRVELPFPIKKASNDLKQTISPWQVAYEPENTPLDLRFFQKKAVLSEKRCLFRDNRIRILVSGKGFPFILNFITYDKVEV